MDKDNLCFSSDELNKLAEKFFNEVQCMYKNGNKWVISLDVLKSDTSKMVHWTKDYLLLWIKRLFGYQGKKAIVLFKFLNDITNWPEDRIKD